MKICSKCKRKRSVKDFYKQQTRKDGLQRYCKDCMQSYQQKWDPEHQYRSTYDHKYILTIRGLLKRKFASMKYRCNNPKARNYKNYGGKGIKCLFESSNEFVDYVINKLQVDPRGLEIDRIDSNSNYERGNIRFVTRSENLRRRMYDKETTDIETEKENPSTPTDIGPYQGFASHR